MNRTLQVIGLLQLFLVSLLLTSFALTDWLIQIFVDCNKFNKGKLNEVHIEWTLKSIQE